MKTALRTIPYVWRNLARRPLRTGLTVAGIAVATFLFAFVESMREGVRAATQAGAAETTAVGVDRATGREFVLPSPPPAPGQPVNRRSPLFFNASSITGTSVGCNPHGNLATKKVRT